MEIIIIASKVFLKRTNLQNIAAEKKIDIRAEKIHLVF